MADVKSQGSQQQGSQGQNMPMQGSGSSAMQSTRGAQGGTSLGRTTGILPSPFHMMRRLSEEMDRMVDEYALGRPGMGMGITGALGGLGLLERLMGQGGALAFQPQIEIFERDNRLLVRADLPGIDKEDVRVELLDDALVLEGERRSEQDVNERGIVRSERMYGRFRRVVPLPPNVNPESAQVVYRNGVLEVTMELQQGSSRGRRLEIREESAGAPQGASRSPRA